MPAMYNFDIDGTDSDDMVPLPECPTVEETIEYLKQFPKDSLLGVSTASVRNEEHPETFMRLYFLEDQHENKIYVGYHKCATADGMPILDEDERTIN